VSKARWNLLIAVVAILAGAWIHITRVPTQDQVIADVAAHVNFQAPDVTLPTLDGESISLKDLRGQVVLINFWATWCQPCRAEMRDIQAAYQAHPNRFVVLATCLFKISSSNFISPFRFCSIPMEQSRERIACKACLRRTLSTERALCARRILAE
jgi:hypothetical protein